MSPTGTSILSYELRPHRGRFCSFVSTILATGAFVAAGLAAPNARAAEPALERFVADVVTRNPGLQARAFERDGARREASAAGLWPDPEIAIMLDNFPEQMGGEMPMVRYQVSQMLMWPGKLAFMEEALKRRADSAAALGKARELELIREAKRSYFMLALNGGLREINRSSRDLLTTIANAAIARYSAGMGGHHEVARAEVERNALDVEAVELDGDRASTLAMMNALRNRAGHSPFPDPPLPHPEEDSEVPPLAQLARLSDHRRPELESMRAMQREEATMASLARRERFPDVMASVWYNQMLGAHDGVGVMLAAKLPLFGVTRQTHRAEAATLRAASAGRDREAMRAMIHFEIADALRRLETARRSLELVVDVAAPRAQESFSSSLSGYSTGALDIVGVLEAWRALQSVERARLDALIARSMARADLERAIGGPIPKAAP